ncbi:MAG: hypothetical protein M1334_00675 [Patescibacteria group bacterium]|nr:hypothetical protein [Patescibacteria group bacterium]
MREKITFNRNKEDKDSDIHKKEESGFMSRLAKKSKEYMIVLGMLGMLGGMVPKAEAQPKQVKESKKIEFAIKETKRIPNKIISFYRAKPEIDKIEGREAKFSPSEIIIDNTELIMIPGGPGMKEDFTSSKVSYEIKMSFVKSEFLDSKYNKIEDWQVKMDTAGYENPARNPLGMVENQISPLKYGENYNLVVEDLRIQERNLWDEAQVVQAFKEIGRKNDPEAQEARKMLERDLADFHKEYQGIKINESFIQEVEK